MQSRKDKLLWISLILICFTTVIDALSEYPLIEAAKIKTGTGDTALGFQDADLPGYGDIRANYFYIGEDNLIYVSDQFNRRIQVYDLNFNHIKEIVGQNEKTTQLNLNDHFKVRDQHIYASLGQYGLLKVDSSGNTIYNIYGKRLASYISSGEYYPYKEYMFYYNEKKQIRGLDENGKDLIQEETEQVISQIHIENPGLIRWELSKKGIAKLDQFLKQNNLLMIGDRVLTTRYEKSKEYIALLQTLLSDKYFKNDISAYESNRSKNLSGFDGNDNSYWITSYDYNKSVITVVSKYGEVLDNFILPLVNVPGAVIAPNGDVYCWDNQNPNYVAFYKIENQWDSFNPAKVKEKKTKIKQKYAERLKTENENIGKLPVQDFFYSPYLTYDKDYYMYHPVKAFDGDPKTAWLEGGEGDGIATGDYIMIIFEEEVEIDEIGIMPGYFDTRWWKENNRIKKMALHWNSNYPILVDFEDRMEEQKIKLDKVTKVKTIVFSFREVYHSDKSNDTAISEIRFYLKGVHQELYLGKMSEYLEKVTREEAERE